ncbi:MAG: glutathione S-transferase family protein [Pseudomonadota bacterium]|nr:glutathione S-transferase family protein [Pseudomonadota bacterium]
MITLYYFHPGCSMAAHIALEESGIPYESVSVDLKNDAERSRLLALNPKGQVPTLVVDGEPLSESIAILSLVADLAPKGRLISEEAFERARCLSLLAWFSSTVHIAFRQSWRPERFTGEAVGHPGIRAHGRDTYWKAMCAIDERLADRDYLMGDTFTIADTYPVVFYNWGLIADHPMASLPHYSAFIERMIARPAVRTILAREGCQLLKP